MKTRFILLALTLFFSCSKEDVIPEVEPNIFLSSEYSNYTGYEFTGYEITLNYTQFQNLKNNEVVFRINATTNVGTLYYEITSQNVENAFSITWATGDVFVKDISKVLSFTGEYFNLEIKISNGKITKSTQLVINIDKYVPSPCETAYNDLYNSINEWMTQNTIIVQNTYAKDYQFSFSVSKDKSLCGFSFPYIFSSSNASMQAQLINEAGDILFSETANAEYSDWYGTYYIYKYVYFNSNDVVLIKDKEYKLKMSYNQDLITNFFVHADFSNIQFPVLWGDLKITEAHYTDVNDVIKSNTAIPDINMGLLPL